MPQGISWFSRFLREDNNFLDPITNNFDSRNPSYPYSSTLTTLFEALGASFWTTIFSFLGFSLRVKAAATYYIATNGNDANDGLTPATAWLTFAHAAAVLALVDFAGQTVTLQAVAGHAAFNATQFALSGWVGGGALIVDLNGGSITFTNPNSTHLTGTIALTGTLPGDVTIQNGTFANTGTDGYIFFMGAYGRLVFGSGLAFGACPTGNGQIEIISGTVFIPQGTSYTIAGGVTPGAHFQIAGGQLICETVTVTLGQAPSKPAFTNAFCFMVSGIAFFSGTQFLPASTNNTQATGRKFWLFANGAITETGGNVNFFPGDTGTQLPTNPQPWQYN